jgi:hypothetical protein
MVKLPAAVETVDPANPCPPWNEPPQAEQAMGYALRIFEVSDAKIKKIFSSKLEFPPTK